MPEWEDLLPRAAPVQPRQNYGQVLDTINQQKESQQRQALQSLVVQQAKRKQRDQDILQQSMAASGGDKDKMLKHAISIGLSPDGLTQLENHLLELRKGGAEAGIKEYDLHQKNLESDAAAIGSFLSLPPEARKRNEGTIRRTLKIPDGEPLPDDDTLRGRANSAIMYGAQLDEGRKEETARLAAEKAANDKILFDTKLPAEQAQAAANAAVANATTKDPGLLAPQARATLEARNAEAAATKADRDIDNARADKQLEIERLKARKSGSDLTADQKNYEAAKKSGFSGTFMDWMRERNPRSSTGTERQSLAYFNRAKGAVDALTEDRGGKTLEQQMADQGLIGQGQLQHAPNLLQTKEQQQYRQAQRAFTEARLRKESGAAIPKHEFENDARTYFIQPGDSPEVIAQKKDARQKVLDGLAFSSGRAYNEFYGEDRPSPQQQPKTVEMMAPNGQVSKVPADQVKYYESKGAKKVR